MFNFCKFVLLIGLLSIACTSHSQPKKLRILNWEEYLSPQVIKRWEEETGIIIEEVYIDNDDIRDNTLANSEDHDIDIAVLDEPASRLFGEAGKLVPVSDYLPQPEMSTLDPFWRNRCGQYSYPYMWGTLGIAYRKDKVSQKPTSWNALLNPDPRLKGHIGMMDDHTDLLAPALFVLGYSLSTDNVDELKEAFEILKKQTPSILTFEYGITFVSYNQRAEDLYMTMAYGGDHHTMNNASGSDQWAYSVPEEGTVLWVDCLSVLTTSQQQKIAMEFIAFLSRPDIAAMNSEDIYFATVNLAALDLISKDFRDDQDIYIPDDVRNRSQLYQVMHVESIKLRQRIANAIQVIHEAD